MRKNEEDMQNMMEDDRNEIALVTGANKGLGREISRQLGKQGMTVLVSARNETRGKEAANELRAEDIDAHFLRIDVTKEDTIEAAVETVEDEFGRLDILVNNAGIAIGPERPSEATADTVRRTYETNVAGVVAVTHAMLPLLRRSSAARVVNMSSPLGSLTLMSDFDNPVATVGLLAYSSSKTALNAITLLYANELRDTDILVNAVSPGIVATDLNDLDDHEAEHSVEQGAIAPIRIATLPADGPTGRFFEEDGEIPW